MRLFSSSTYDPIYWRLKTTDPQIFPINNYEDYQVVNPLYYPSIDERILGDFEERNRKVDDDEYLLYSYSIVYQVSEDLSFEEVTENIINISSSLVSALKYHSKQPTFKNRILGSIEYEVDELSILLDQIKYLEDEFEPKYNLATAIDSSVIENAAQNINLEPPIYDELVLDAISAYKRKDFRMCILNCAAALETACSKKLENIFEEIKSDEDNSDHLRILEMNKGGETHYYDPIFKYLSQSNNFRTLLHELPLYLLKKSLHDDEKDLYDFADKLYNTRSKLIHNGKINPNSDKNFELTDKNAKKSIKTVVAILDWFNIKEEYHFKDDGLTLLPRR